MPIFVRDEGVPDTDTVRYYIRLAYVAGATPWTATVVSGGWNGAELQSFGPYETKLLATLAASDYIESLHGILG